MNRGASSNWSKMAAVVAFGCLAAACSSGKLPSAVPDTTPATVATAPTTTLATTLTTTGTAAPFGQLDPLSAPMYKPTTRTEELEMDLDAHPGQVTLQQAIDMFAATFGAMPGATPSELPAGDGVGTSTAFAAIEAHRSELTNAQQQIVDAYLGTTYTEFDLDGKQIGSTLPPSTTADTTVTADTSVSASTADTTVTAGTTATVDTTDISTASTQGPTSAHGFVSASYGVTATTAAPSTTSPPLDDLQIEDLEPHLGNLFTQTLKDFRSKLPGLLDSYKTIRLTLVGDTPASTPAALMLASLDPDNPNGCWVRVLPRFIHDGYDDEDAKFAFAHELFHCAEAVWNKSFYADAPWLIEGAATYAASYVYHETYHPNDAILPYNWFDSTQPEPLAVASYHAWPLFDSYRQSSQGADPFIAIKNMVSQPLGLSTADLVGIGGFSSPIFTNLWTSVAYRTTTFNDDAWEFSWPGTSVGYGPHNVAVTLPGGHGIGEYSVQGQGNFIHQNLLLPFTSDVGLLGVVPHQAPMLTRSGTQTITVPEGQIQWFCTNKDQCPCPGSSKPSVDLLPMATPMLISMATIFEQPTVEVHALAWEPDKDCGQTPPDTGHEPGAMPGGTGSGGGASTVSGSANGDPHMTTLNGLSYEFMSLGEFVTTTDPSGDMTVQERHQPTGAGATIGAAAIGSGAHRATFTASQMGDDGNITVRLDGTQTTAAAFDIGDVSVAKVDGKQTWVATWPDGSSFTVDWNHGFFVKADLAKARATKVTGVLGTYSTNFLHDLALPDGTAASPADNYKAFADAWLVTDKDTLFDYDSGQNTETFRQPHPLARLTATQQTITLCTKTLGDQATSNEVHSCEFDITATGSTSYAATYKTLTDARVANIPVGNSIIRPSAASGAPPIVVGANTPIGGTAPATEPQTNGTAPSGSTLSLKGVIGDVAGQPEGQLLGSMELKKGTVLLTSMQCPSDTTINVHLSVTARTDGSASGVGLCGDLWGSETYDANEHAETHVGEGYLIIHADGIYDIAIQSETYGTTAMVSADLYADPDPTILENADIPASGFKQTLSGIADTIVFDAAPGDGAEWTIGNGDKACTQVYYLSPETDPQTSPDDLGGDCWHQTDLSIGPATFSVPIVIFNRTATPVDVTITKK